MTFVEIENSLPSGFHDSALKQLLVDYENRALRLEMAISVGDPDGPAQQRDDYRNASIRLSGLLFCIVQPPDPAYYSDLGREVWITDAYDTRSMPELIQQIDPQLIKRVPAESFLCSLFVNDWNSFLHIAATGAEFAWSDARLFKHRGPRRHFVPGETVSDNE